MHKSVCRGRDGLYQMYYLPAKRPIKNKNQADSISTVPIQCLLKITRTVNMRPTKEVKIPNILNGLHIFISALTRASDIFLCLSMLEPEGFSFIMLRIEAAILGVNPYITVLNTKVILY